MIKELGNITESNIHGYITLYIITYSQIILSSECSYLSKFISTIELVFCGQILESIIVREKSGFLQVGHLGFKSNTLL